MKISTDLERAEGKALEQLVLDRAGVMREWGETDDSLRQRAAFEFTRASFPWKRPPEIRRRWWARLWYWIIGIRP